MREQEPRTHAHNGGPVVEDDLKILNLVCAYLDLIPSGGIMSDRVGGLEAGAHDHLVKPLSPAELMARVEAMIRRFTPAADAVLSHGDLELDIARHELRQSGRRVEVSALQLKMLTAILMARGRVLSRNHLADSIGAAGYKGVLGRSVDVYVFRLRQKLGDSADNPRYIETVRGVGYRSVSA